MDSRRGDDELRAGEWSSTSKITRWDPPRMFAKESDGWVPGMAVDGDRVEC